MTPTASPWAGAATKKQYPWAGVAGEVQPTTPVATTPPPTQVQKPLVTQQFGAIPGLEPPVAPKKPTEAPPKLEMPVQELQPKPDDWYGTSQAWLESQIGRKLSRGEYTNQSIIPEFGKYYFALLGEMGVGGRELLEEAREYKATFPETLKVLGQSFLQLPRQVASSVLSATQGQGGASVVNKDWADIYISEAGEDIDKFTRDVAELYPSDPYITEVAQLSRNLAYSITTMGVGAPFFFLPFPGSRKLAYAIGTVTSGAIAYQMTTYQITQLYLEFKNAEKIEQTGKGITLEEENQLKADFHSLAVKYGLWEAIPEALSNLAFASILTAPLTRIGGASFASKMVAKIAAIYGEEFLTETITQKGQSAIEVEAGLREERIGWIEAFKEIAPQTFLLTTIMAGAGQVIISSTQGIKKITASLKTEIGTDHILYNEIKQGIETDIDSVVTTPETVTGVEPTITEAPTVAMAEWGGVTGRESWQITQAEYVESQRLLLRREADGKIEPLAENVRQNMLGEHRRDVQQALSEGKPVPAEVLKDYPDLKVTPRVTEVTPEVTKPAVTGFEGLDTTTEGEATMEVSGVPPKPPTNWDKVGGDLYDRYKKQVTPNPTPNTVPLSDRARRALRKVEKYVADEFAELNKLGWQAEVDVAMVRASGSHSAQLYRGTMKAVSESIDNDSNLLSYVDDYLMLRHQLEILKSTDRKYFTAVRGEVTERFTAKQIGLLFAQMKKELGAANYAKVKKAAEHIPAVYNQILRGTEELTPGQIEGLIRKYPWYNPILFEGESRPIDIGRRLSPRQVKQLTTLESDKEQISPLLSLPTTISRRIRAQAINTARQSIANLAVDPKNKVLIGGDVAIVIRKPKGAFIDYYEGGQHKYLKLGKGTEWIAKDIELLQRQPPNVMIKAVRSLQNLSKMFFTTYNPGFVAWNTAFDAMTAYFAEGITPFGFGKALAGNIKGMFADVAGLNEFRESGGELFGFFEKAPDIGKERAITPFISRKGGQLVLRNPESLKRFINPFVFIRELGIAGENAGRRATFEKAIREGLSRKEASLRARRVTVDFSRFSKASRHINDWYIYFNPALQGFMLPGRAIKKDPRSLWRLAALAVGYVGLTLYNTSYDEYDDVRDSDKTGKLLVMLPSDEYNKYGQKVPHYLTLLPLREFAFFTAPIEYLVGRLRTEEPEAYRTLAQEWDVLYPVISPLSMISETGGLVMPTQIGATIQQIVQNHDDFRDRPIVDDEMELLPPSQQYDQYTNALAIKAGQALGMSPKKLDFFVSNMFGALGNDLLREVNRAIELIDREEVDERIAGLVNDLRSIPTTVPPNQIEVARETFLEGLSVEDRDLVLNMEHLPDDKIPFVQSIFRRFFRDYGGQVYATAKEKALMGRTLEDYPPDALAKLQKDAVENANNLLKGTITKKQYDDARTRYRAYYSGASTAEWREGMTEGAVARSDIDKYMPESYQRSEEFQAVSAYMEIRQKYIDEAGGVFDAETWDKIERQTLTDLRKDYSETAIRYAIAHKDDWIDKLPEPARTVERQRAIALENGTWWDDYRGTVTKEPTSPWTGATSESPWGGTSESPWAGAATK